MKWMHISSTIQHSFMRIMFILQLIYTKNRKEVPLPEATTPQILIDVFML